MEDGYQRERETNSPMASTQPTLPRDIMADDVKPRKNETQVPAIKKLARPLWKEDSW